MHRCPMHLAGMIGKYRIEVANHQFGEFVTADFAVQYLKKRGWSHPDEENQYFKLRLKANGLEFEASVVFVQVPHKLLDLPRQVRWNSK